MYLTQNTNLENHVMNYRFESLIYRSNWYYHRNLFTSNSFRLESHLTEIKYLGI